MRLMAELSLTEESREICLSAMAMAELFRAGRASQILRSLLASRREAEVWRPPTPLGWGSAAGEFLAVSLDAVWPGSNSMVFPNFLISTGRFRQLAVSYPMAKSPEWTDLLHNNSSLTDHVWSAVLAREH